jgi:hypothetical protein
MRVLHTMQCQHRNNSTVLSSLRKSNRKSRFRPSEIHENDSELSEYCSDDEQNESSFNSQTSDSENSFNQNLQVDNFTFEVRGNNNDQEWEIVSDLPTEFMNDGNFVIGVFNFEQFSIDPYESQGFVAFLVDFTRNMGKLCFT